MAGWKDEYLSHLRNAEKNNPVNMDIIEACINCPPHHLSFIPSSPEAWVESRRPVD